MIQKTVVILVGFIMLLYLPGCKKHKDLGPTFDQVLGTYTSIDKESKVTIDTKHRVVCNISAERGYHFRIGKIYVPSQSIVHYEGSDWNALTLSNRDAKGKNLTIYSKVSSDTVLIFIGTKVADFTAFSSRAKFIKGI